MIARPEVVWTTSNADAPLSDEALDRCALLLLELADKTLAAYSRDCEKQAGT